MNLVFCWGIFLQTYGQRLLQAVGDTVLSMVSLIIGAVVNIILDPIMIFGLLGCPAMGIRGAAIATVIGQLIGAAAALWFNRVKNPVIHVRLKGYRFLWQDVADIYRVGLPTIVMQAIGSVMTFAVNGILLGVSSTAVAFFGIYYKLQNFLMMPVNGLGQAAIPVVGFNYGSGQSDRVKQAWKVLLPTGVVFALCGTAVFLLFPAQLLGLFSASDEMLAFGVPALRIISVTFLFAVNQESKTVAQQVLVYVLDQFLRLLHPFMPFITEEIWQAIPHEGESIMIAPWPTTSDDLNFPAEEAALSRLWLPFARCGTAGRR